MPAAKSPYMLKLSADADVTLQDVDELAAQKDEVLAKNKFKFTMDV